QDRFREDLYYRLNVITINLPALNERPADIPLLAMRFMKNFCISHNRIKLGITDRAMEALQRYDWPGNIRELENVLERAVLLSKTDHITLEDLPANIISHVPSAEPADFSQTSLKDAISEPERKIIRAALEANNWNRQLTAQALQINRTTLYKKMKKYGLEEEAQRLGIR
ncbi:MAG: helix-turn-helix domain-containing protein, partial [Phycisphaerae bacterium]|nr:helix-turn-helix domain-containing protein [Phycisphaerae bacterium]